LLREYRRDVRRYFDGQRDDYPELPEGYLSPVGVALMDEFAARVRTEGPEPTLWSTFPFDRVATAVSDTWRPTSWTFYSNWLRQIASELGSDAGPATLARA
jgi:homoserine O-succinyltransferase